MLKKSAKIGQNLPKMDRIGHCPVLIQFQAPGRTKFWICRAGHASRAGQFCPRLRVT
jgi:hypothetical protein